MNRSEILDLYWIRRDVSMGGVFFYLFEANYFYLLLSSAANSTIVKSCVHECEVRSNTLAVVYTERKNELKAT